MNLLELPFLTVDGFAIAYRRFGDMERLGLFLGSELAPSTAGAWQKHVVSALCTRSSIPVAATGSSDAAIASRNTRIPCYFCCFPTQDWQDSRTKFSGLGTTGR